MVPSKFTILVIQARLASAQANRCSQIEFVRKARSIGDNEARPRIIELGFDRYDLFVIPTTEFQMNAAHFPIARSGGGSNLLDRPAPIIFQFRFHGRHPPMARLRFAHASRSTGAFRITVLAALTDSLRSTC